MPGGDPYRVTVVYRFGRGWFNAAGTNTPLSADHLADKTLHLFWRDHQPYPPAAAPRDEGLPKTLRGDGPCSRCGTADLPVWFTDSPFWNAVVRSEPLPWCEGDGFMCINCFVRLADERGYPVTGWRLTPDRGRFSPAPAATETGDQS